MTAPTAPTAITTTTMGARDVLRLPDFRRLWLAQAISDIGDGLTLLTLMLLVNDLTGSTLALAAVAIALAVPPLTIGLVAGTYADRWDRRKIMIVVGHRCGRSSSSASSSWGPPTSCPLLVVLAFVQASIGTFFTPARGAMMPHVVPEGGPARRELDHAGHAGHRRRHRHRAGRVHRRGRGRHLAGLRPRCPDLPGLGGHRPRA